MSAIELYNAPQSTCSQKVRLTLAEKGLSFKEHRLKLFAGDQLRPEYLKLNPNGVVPTLIHDGTPIIDSSVIMEYLDEVFPSPQLSSERPSYATAFYPGLLLSEQYEHIAALHQARARNPAEAAPARNG